MKKLPWLISGLLTLGGFPVLLAIELRRLRGDTDIAVPLINSLEMVPLVWAVALAVCLYESRHQQKASRMRLYSLLPYAAWAMHFVVLGLCLSWRNRT
jgi:hypothetical protein